MLLDKGKAQTNCKKRMLSDAERQTVLNPETAYL